MEIDDRDLGVTFKGVLKKKSLEQHIGEYTQAQQETLANDDGRKLFVEPGRYPVVTVLDQPHGQADRARRDRFRCHL